MKVLFFDTERRVGYVELSRRNLEVLLEKLNGKKEGHKSACSILKVDKAGTIQVFAVENEEHYSEREPGPMLVKGEVV